VPSEGAPYPLFVLCGLVPWNFFSRAIASMTGSLVSNQELVRRVYLPRMTIPISAMLSSVVDMLLGFVIILGALAYFSVVPSVQLLLLPFFLAILAASTLGIGLTLAAINVRFRDVGYIVPFALQLLLFVSPIVYPASIMPEAWRPLYSINPMVGLIEAVRWSVIGTEPDWHMVAISATCSIVLLVLGMIIFARAERAFADVI
jgi:lipopolysaccharide transport system permease protein